MISLDYLILQFFIFSIAGWLLEVTYRSITYGEFVNPGFHRGPYVPLYGVMAVFIIITHSFISTYPIYIRAIVYLGVTTILELITGEILLRVFKKRFWDYSDNFKNFRGHICPSFSVIWIFACLFFEFLLLPVTTSIISQMPYKLIKANNILMLITLTIDFLYSSNIITHAYTAGQRGMVSSAVKLDSFLENYETIIPERIPIMTKNNQVKRILYSPELKNISTVSREHLHTFVQRNKV